MSKCSKRVIPDQIALSLQSSSQYNTHIYIFKGGLRKDALINPFLLA